MLAVGKMIIARDRLVLVEHTSPSTRDRTVTPTIGHPNIRIGSRRPVGRSVSMLGSSLSAVGGLDWRMRVESPVGRLGDECPRRVGPGGDRDAVWRTTWRWRSRSPSADRNLRQSTPAIPLAAAVDLRHLGGRIARAGLRLGAAADAADIVEGTMTHRGDSPMGGSAPAADGVVCEFARRSCLTPPRAGAPRSLRHHLTAHSSLGLGQPAGHPRAPRAPLASSASTRGCD